MQLISVAATLAFLAATCAGSPPPPPPPCPESAATSVAALSTSPTPTSSPVALLAIATVTTTGTFYEPTAFLPPAPNSFSTCSNATSGTGFSASDLAMLAALLNTNITAEFAPTTLYPQVTIPANGTVTYTLGSVNAAFTYSVTIPEQYITVGINYIYDIMQTVRLCCAVSGFQYCTGTTYIELGVADVLLGGKWSLGANMTYSGMPALTQN
jgi:hypothetical protein